MSFNWKNWNKQASAVLVLITLLVNSGAVWSEQLLSLLHEAPFPVSDAVDLWVIWLLKVGAFIMTVVTIFTRKKELPNG